MSERKVLNKYYPPDFDPTKIPKLKLERNRQFSIRIMAPFNMRCSTCGEYIYKGKKFNSRKETVETENYLGLYIFRFYIKCPRCVAEIAFKTDPENCDYTLEDGATRNFEAHRTAEEMAKKELKAIEEEEKNNPMKVLENRTKASQREMEALEDLEELRDINSRHAKLDHEQLIQMATAYKEQLSKLQDEEDEAFIESIFGKKSGEEQIKRLHDDDSAENALAAPQKKLKSTEKPTDFLTENTAVKKKKTESWQRSVGSLMTKSLAGTLVKKKPVKTSEKPASVAVSSERDTQMPHNKAPEVSGAEKEPQVKAGEQAAKPPVSALSLVGSYSDSDSNESDSA